MGHFTVLYGYINGLGNVEKNAHAIAMLPESDDRPALTRDMFAVPKQEHVYWEELITFGRIYNGVEACWEEWLVKFGALLRTMEWSHVRVHLETECWGNYIFEWTPMSYEELPDDVIPPSPLPWKFSGGPRTNLREAYEQRQAEERQTSGQ